MKAKRLSDDRAAQVLLDWTAGKRVVPLDEGMELVRRAAQALRVRGAILKAIDHVDAALGDRLLARGPLSKAYAHAVMRTIRDAQRLAGERP